MKLMRVPEQTVFFGEDDLGLGLDSPCNFTFNGIAWTNVTSCVAFNIALERGHKGLAAKILAKSHRPKAVRTLASRIPGHYLTPWNCAALYPYLFQAILLTKFGTDKGKTLAGDTLFNTGNLRLAYCEPEEDYYSGLGIGLTLTLDGEAKDYQRVDWPESNTYGMALEAIRSKLFDEDRPCPA